MRVIRAQAVAAVAGALLLAGCGGSSTAGAGCDGLEGGDTGARALPGSPEGLAYLTDVRVESDGCVDRLSFDFRDEAGEPPGARVRYLPAAQALVEDGSGDAVEADGSSFLVVRIEPAATAEIVGEELVVTYEGRRVDAGGARFVRDLVKSGDFEAAVTWVVGLPEERPFRVLRSASPPRLVVEVG